MSTAIISNSNWRTTKKLPSPNPKTKTTLPTCLSSTQSSIIIGTKSSIQVIPFNSKPKIINKPTNYISTKGELVLSSWGDEVCLLRDDEVVKYRGKGRCRWNAFLYNKIVSSGNLGVSIYDIEKGLEANLKVPGRVAARGCFLGKSYSLLITGLSNNTSTQLIDLRVVNSMKPLHEFPASTSLRFHPNNDYIFSLVSREQTILYDLRNTKENYKLAGGKNFTWSIVRSDMYCIDGLIYDLRGNVYNYSDDYIFSECCIDGWWFMDILGDVSFVDHGMESVDVVIEKYYNENINSSSTTINTVAGEDEFSGVVDLSMFDEYIVVNNDKWHLSELFKSEEPVDLYFCEEALVSGKSDVVDELESNAKEFNLKLMTKFSEVKTMKIRQKIDLVLSRDVIVDEDEVLELNKGVIEILEDKMKISNSLLKKLVEFEMVDINYLLGLEFGKNLLLIQHVPSIAHLLLYPTIYDKQDKSDKHSLDLLFKKPNMYNPMISLELKIQQILLSKKSVKEIAKDLCCLDIKKTVSISSIKAYLNALLVLCKVDEYLLRVKEVYDTFDASDVISINWNKVKKIFSGEVVDWKMLRRSLDCCVGHKNGLYDGMLDVVKDVCDRLVLRVKMGEVDSSEIKTMLSVLKPDEDKNNDDGMNTILCKLEQYLSKS